MPDDAKALLGAAFDDLIASLQQARNAIDDPALMPPPETDRNLAEGYRYLMGFVHSAVERAFHSDPERPSFHNALSIINRATIDNSDAIYFTAEIDGRHAYRISGRVDDHREWRGEEPIEGGPRAPHYVIFEATHGVLAGDSGSLRELAPGTKTLTGRLDSTTIEVEPDGRFEILLAPEKPAEHSGNFISTRKESSVPDPTDPDSTGPRYANHISGRQLFNDWENEEAIHLEIRRVDTPDAPAPYTPEQAAAELRRCGEIVRGQMHFWNAFWTILMGTYGHREGGIPGVEFPRNAFNQINAASGATGGGMSTNLYAGGVFELEPGEALVVENEIRIPAQYVGFQLGNLWGESIEYASALGSLNGRQCEIDPDGVIRLVIAHEDPGVPNWLDTTGHREGFMTPRWAYSELPESDQWPRIRATKVALDEVRKHLHPSTREVSAEERAAQIEIRERHVHRRFRPF